MNRHRDGREPRPTHHLSTHVKCTFPKRELSLSLSLPVPRVTRVPALHPPFSCRVSCLVLEAAACTRRAIRASMCAYMSVSEGTPPRCPQPRRMRGVAHVPLVPTLLSHTPCGPMSAFAIHQAPLVSSRLFSLMNRVASRNPSVRTRPLPFLCSI